MLCTQKVGHRTNYFMYKHHPFEERLEAIRLLAKGLSFNAVGKQLGTGHHMIILWSKMYEQYGIEGLRRPYSKNPIKKNNDDFSCKCAKKSVSLHSKRANELDQTTMGRPKKKAPETELEKLQEELEYLRAENALLKKVRALMAEKEARLLETGRKPSSH